MPVAAMQALASRYGGWVAVAAGAACSLAFAPAAFFPLGIACPAILFLLWEGAPPRRAAFLGLCYGAGLFLSGTYWIYTAVHVFGKAPAWLALFLMAGLVAIMAAYYALIGYVLARLVPRPSLHRWLLALPAAWVLMEERLRDAAAFARRCGQLCTPVLMEPLAKVANSLERYADQLAASA